MKFPIKYVLIFLILNFAALVFGVYLMDGGPVSNWYIQLQKAPWTPPNPAFGICWSIIMICFTFYMAHLVKNHVNSAFLIFIYSIQWILNSGWNYIFFNQHLPVLGVFTILSLFLIIAYLLFRFSSLLKWNSLWILPYFLWLIVAISLNVYIVLNNP